MQKIPDIESELYPPFDGFPREGLSFLRQLKRNNKREWFNAHKDQYETFVRLPMLSLISSLQPFFREFAPEFDLNPKRSIFRIYRDVRFSKDKSPYKTHVAAHFVLRGKPKGIEGSGYYLHIEPREVFLGGGIYIPDSDQLKKIRRAMVERPDDFLAVVRDRTFKRLFGTIEGEKLQRMPLGFPPDHPLQEWLKLKQFFVGVTWAEARCYSATFPRDAARVFEAATPLVRFLNSAMR